MSKLNQTPLDKTKLLQKTSFYSKLNGELVDLLLNDTRRSEQQISFENTDTVEFMQSYEYAMSTWPVVISTELIADFNHFNQLLPSLLKKAMVNFFKRDQQAFSDYLHVPPLLLELLHNAPLDLRSMINRHDMVFTDGCFKLLEVNAGTTIGGWQHDWVHEVYHQHLKNDEVTTQWPLQYRHVSALMFKAVLDAIVRANKPGATGKVLFVDKFAQTQTSANSNDQAQTYQGLLDCLEQVFNLNIPRQIPNAQLVFCKQEQDIEFLPDGEVIYQGQVMDAVLLPLPPGVRLDPTIYLKLMSSFLKQQIVFPDSAVHTLFGNKHLLTLLHEDSLKELFSQAELTLIERHIPWSCKLYPRQVNYQGQTHDLVSLLKKQKDCFVIKKSQSYQGCDVFVGVHFSHHEWAEVINKVITQSDWMAQQYCPPDEVLACAPDVGVVPHELVWGVFDFDNSYAGAFVRGVEVKRSNGVINSANGATEFIVFEQQPKSESVVSKQPSRPKKQKLVI